VATPSWESLKIANKGQAISLYQFDFFICHREESSFRIGE